SRRTSLHGLPEHILCQTTQETRKIHPSKRHFFDETPDLLLPFRVFDNSGFLIHQPIPDKPNFRIEPRTLISCEKACQSPGESDSQVDSLNLSNGYEEDFDAESILDEEVEEGIDSIMGNLSVKNECVPESNVATYCGQISSCYGHPLGLGFGGRYEFDFGMRRGVKAFRHADEGDWWRYPTVDVLNISPKLNRAPVEKKKKKVEKPEAKNSESPKESSSPKQQPKESQMPESKPGLLLKLNYDGVASAWSDRGSPFEEILGQDAAATGNDLHARLAQIELFSESGGVREASVLRYKEKRRTRLFSKKIRYHVRKVNADRRPRMK
ncbi:hypothetical protein NMG60_11023793, partial [Bertholletia excelsa]